MFKTIQDPTGTSIGFNSDNVSRVEMYQGLAIIMLKIGDSISTNVDNTNWIVDFLNSSESQYHTWERLR